MEYLVYKYGSQFCGMCLLVDRRITKCWGIKEPLRSKSIIAVTILKVGIERLTGHVLKKND